MRTIWILAGAALMLAACDNISFTAQPDTNETETAQSPDAPQNTSPADTPVPEPAPRPAPVPSEPTGDADAAVSADLPISRAVFDFMIEKEVTSRTRYEAYAAKPHYGGGNGGVLIGFGFNIGSTSKDTLWDHWGGYLGDAQLKRLEKAIGVNKNTDGEVKVRALVEDLSDITIPWDAALAVYETKMLPDFVSQVRSAVPNTDKLHPHGMGALVSLAYNRGSGGFRSDRERYREMRAIRTHMENEAFARVPVEFRGMKRLYTNERLQQRREDEAVFFERGLALQ